MTRHRNDVKGLADIAEALEDEICALSAQDPYHPQVQKLRERLHSTVEELYRQVPRGV